MRAVTFEPRRPGSARLEDVPDPARQAASEVLVRACAVGICGTDRELLAGRFGKAPPAEARLVLGHESLGRVVEAPQGSALKAGDLVVGIVRHPDPEPCPNCAVGEWDMCSNGRYTERGIKGAHGFASELYTLGHLMAVKVDPALGMAAVLLEPASVVAKAWEHIECIGRRARWTPRRVLVTGAGPVGLMAALMGRQRRLDVQVLDRNETGPKPSLVRALGAAYVLDEAEGEHDIVIECTGAPQVIRRVLEKSRPNQIVCLTGLAGPSEEQLGVAAFNQAAVRGNRVVFGSVNANRRHFEAAAQSLAAAGREWLDGLLTRKVPLARWQDAYERRRGDVKTVLTFED